MKQGLVQQLRNRCDQQVDKTRSREEAGSHEGVEWTSCPAESAARLTFELGPCAAGLRSGTGGCST